MAVMDAAKIRILVEANSAGVASGLAPGIVALGAFEQKARGSVERVRMSFANLTGGAAILLGLGGAAGLLAVAMAASIGPAIAFETAFSNVRKTVDGTPEALGRIRDGLVDMSRTMPTAATDLADIAANAGQLGIKAPQILEFTKVIAQLGETTNLSFDDAAQSLARFLNITGNKSSITEIADVLVELGNNSATTESQIVQFSTRLASAFTVAGASEAQILSLAASFSSLGVQAEAGGSSLSVIITNISDAAKGGNTNLETFARVAGVLPEDFRKIALSSPVEAMLLFGEGLGRITAEGKSITPVLADVGLQGLRTSEAMRLLALNSDQVRDSLALAEEQMINGGAAQEEYDKKVETTASRLEIFKNRLNAVHIAAGSTSLDALARLVDAAGDAIEGLVEILTPLAKELMVTFGHGAELVELFWNALGGPAVKLAVAALVGAVQALTGLLSILNDLGPAGLAIAVIVADIALVGPASVTAAAGLKAVSGSLASVGVSGTAAAAGVKATNAAMAVGPYVALAAVLVLVGKAFVDANNAARDSGDKWTEGVGKALASGDFAKLENQLANLRNRQAELNEIGFRESWADRMGLAVKGYGQILNPFVDRDILNARQELKKLDELAADNGWATYEADLRGTASVLGISVDETFDLANQMGLLGQLTGGTGEEMRAARDAMKDAAAASQVLADGMGTTAQKILDGSITTGQLAEALGITEKQLAYVADGIEGVSFDDLFDEDAEKRILAAEATLDKVRGTFEPLAAAVGLTTEKYLEQVEAIGRLAGSYGDLESAINGTISALDTVGAAEERSAAAIISFGEALSSVDSGTESIIAAAAAGRELLGAYAGTGPTMDQFVARQAEVVAQFYETAVAAGANRDEVLDLIATTLRIPPSVVTELLLKAEQFKAEEAIVRDALERFTVQEWVAIIKADPSQALEAPQAVRIALLDFTSQEYRAALTADERPALGNLANASIRAREYADQKYLATLEADYAPAAEDARFATLEALDFATQEYLATLKADERPAFGTIANASIRAREYADDGYTAVLDADETRASETITATHQSAKDYAADDYTAKMTAEDWAVETIGTVHSTARNYADDDYTAGLMADDQASYPISTAEALARGFAKDYDADLYADEKPALSSLALALEYLARFADKTITLRTNYVSFSSAFAEGGIAFARGGITDTRPRPATVTAHAVGSIDRATLEHPGPARIYRTASPGRLFAEPVTGGEAYIPLAHHNRTRSRRIWAETGRHLGMPVTHYATGGISGTASESLAAAIDRGGDVSIRATIEVSPVIGGGPPPASTPQATAATIINFAAPIDVTVNATPGMDPQALAGEITTRVHTALEQMGRELTNLRINA